MTKFLLLLLHHLLLVLLVALLFGGTFVAAYGPDGYTVYHNLSSYYTSIDELTRSQPQYVRLLSTPPSYMTYNGHPLHVLHVTDHRWQYNLLGGAKIRVLMSFGEHAREFFAVESMLDLIHYLTHASQHQPCSSYDGQFARHVLMNMDLHLIGMLNPDGRQHVEESGDYCYRNTAPGVGGVDINRNFDWEFGGPSSTRARGSEEYSGARPFEIAETRIIRDLQTRHRYDGFLSIHSGEQQIFAPFVDSVSKRTRRTRPQTGDELDLINSIVAATNGYFHDSGVAYEYNSYAADGSMFDWMGGVANVTYSLCAEIWGGGPQPLECFEQFNPPPHSLKAALEKLRPFWRALLWGMYERLLPAPASTAYPLPPSLRRQPLDTVMNRMCELEYGLRYAHVHL